MRGKRFKRQQRKKSILRLAVISIGVLLLLFIALGVIANSVITRDFLIEEIEDSINSDVEIGKVSVSVFRFPTRVTLTDVSLTPVETDKDNDASVKIERVDLQASLFALLIREVNVTSIAVSGADITTTYREDGSTSIEDLFKKPDVDDSGDSGEESTDEKKSDGFNALEQEDFVARLGRLTIEDSRANVLLEEMGLKLMCTNLNIELSEMRVDPRRLEETDTARLSIAVDVKADSVEGWQFGELFIRGDASARIFNAQTGKTEPDIKGDFNLTSDSWLNTQIPFITKSWNMLGVLEKVGIKIAKLPERASFGRSESIAAHYHLGKIDISKPLSIWVGDWELAVLDQSWLHTGTDEHVINGELLASESASGTFLSIIEKGVAFLPDEAKPIVMENVSGKLYRNNRLFIPIKSSGDFSDPKIRASGDIPDLAESAKEAAKKLLEDKAKGLLKGLLDRD